MNNTQSLFDRAAIGTSTLCLLHCAALPIVISLFPSLFSITEGDHHFHLLLVWLVVPLSFVALLMGCRKHKDNVKLAIGASGVAALVAVAMFGHDFLGEMGEKIGTVIASLVIVYAHIRNQRQCKASGCQH